MAVTTVSASMAWIIAVCAVEHDDTRPVARDSPDALSIRVNGNIDLSSLKGTAANPPQSHWARTQQGSTRHRLFKAILRKLS